MNNFNEGDRVKIVEIIGHEANWKVGEMGIWKYGEFVPDREIEGSHPVKNKYVFIKIGLTQHQKLKEKEMPKIKELILNRRIYEIGHRGEIIYGQ